MSMRQALSIVKKHLGNAKLKTPVITEILAKQKSKVDLRTNMEREIFEQPDSIRRALQGRVDFQDKSVILNEVSHHIAEILRCKRIIIIGAASSYHAAVGTRQLMEEMLELPVFVELASDFLDRDVPVFRDDFCIFVSQSGETSSVLKACEYCKNHDALMMSITNGEMSSLKGMADFSLDIKVGTELGITSTKSYTGQFITIVLFTLLLASDKKTKIQRIKDIITELEELPNKIENVLMCSEALRELSKGFVSSESVLVMGRGYQQASCLEGSFKLKEVSNVHSEGIHSGELKHGPLALIDDKIPIIMIIMRDGVYDKCMNALQQVKARNGKPILICEKGDVETSKMSNNLIQVPKTIDCLSSILTIIPLQLISLHLAVLLNRNVDQPSGLVKTVIENSME